MLAVPPLPPASAHVVTHGGPPLPEAELVARALGGSAWAEAALCRLYARPLIAMLTRLIGNATDADDIAQDALVIALRDLARLKTAGAFRGWLFGIATNLAKKLLRRRKLERFLGLAPHADALDLEQYGAAGASPETRAELALIGARLAVLPVDLRVAWSLRFVEGYELTEVAELCDCSLATIKRRLDKATQRLDAHVALERRGS